MISFKQINKYWLAIETFFNTECSFYALGLMRVMVTGALCGLYIWRQLDVKFFFTDGESIILKQQALDMIPAFYRTPLAFFIWPESLVPSMHLLLIFCLSFLYLHIFIHYLFFIFFL
jgi:hypothetical protein